MRLISFILSLNVPARSSSAAWHRFAFLRQMNIPAPSGNSMATAQSPLYGDREMLSLAHQPPCLVLYLLSLSPYHSRDVFHFPLSPQPSLVAFSLSFSPCDNKTLPRLITFIIRPGLLWLAFHILVSLCEQSEKRNSLPDDESRWLIGERISGIVSYFCSTQFLFSHDFIIICNV